jgi:hypothetical protein
MKKLLLLLTLFIACIPFSFSQSPESFSYQAIVRDSEGNVLQDQEISLRISILQNSLTGNAVYIEEHTATSNSFGLVQLNIGNGTIVEGTFSAIEWGSAEYFIQVEMDLEGGTNYSVIGTSQLLSVPYAIYATHVSNTDDADADATNEIQNLTLDVSSNELSISQGNAVKLPYDSSFWKTNDSTVYYIGKRVGVGSQKVNSKLEVRADDSFTSSDTLFVVKDNQGKPVFAVFPDGAKIFVDESQKGKVGGFAISGRTASKAAEQDIFRVTPDSTRIYINEPAKGKVGGFAISGRTASKLGVNDIMFANSDSTRIYINDQAKGKVGGFAISGRTASKGMSDYFNVSGSSAADTVDPSQPMVLWYPKREAFFTGRVLIESPDSVGFNSVSTGFESKAVGDFSHALGYKARSFGHNSTAIGNDANAIGQNAYSFGDSARAEGITSFAIGDHAYAKGVGAYAIGSIGRDTATNEPTGQPAFAGGDYSFALGMGTKATNTSSFAMGNQTVASGAFSTASGLLTQAEGIFSTAMGFKTQAEGKASLAFGVRSRAIGDQSIALGGVPPNTEGVTLAQGLASISIGKETQALKPFSIAMGDSAIADSVFAMALGKATKSSGFASLSMGYYTEAGGDFATSMGNQTVATGKYSVSMGHSTVAGGEASLAMGRLASAGGNFSMAIGDNSNATGNSSFSMGTNVSATNVGSFAMGANTTASGMGSIAMGYNLKVSGNGSFGINLGSSIVETEITSSGVMSIMNGAMGVGTVAPASKLEVAGGDVTVSNGSLNVANGDVKVSGGSFIDDGTQIADYVFENDYQIKTIEEHAKFMWRNKHLPAVSSAKEIEEKNGYDISERREQILEELEIAHIYIEQLNKRIKELKTENEELKEKVQEIDVIKEQLKQIQESLNK